MWDQIRAKTKPGDIILLTDILDDFSIKYFLAVVGLLLFGEALSLIMVCGILKYLRKNVSLFSKSTYKLHVQFTLLLAVQVDVKYLLQTFSYQNNILIPILPAPQSHVHIGHPGHFVYSHSYHSRNL
jgi:hypothetical protein